MSAENLKPYPNNLVEGLPGPSFPRRTAAATMIIAAGLAAYSGTKLSGDPIMWPKVAVDYFTDVDCDTPSDEAFGAVDAALADRNTIGTHILYQISLEAEQLQDFNSLHANYAIETANSLGLTLADYRPAKAAIEQAESRQQVLQILNSYTVNHGFGVSIPNETDIKDLGLGIEPVEEDEIDFQKFKNGSIALMNALFYIPTEITNDIDLGEMRIVSSISPVLATNKKPSALAALLSDVIYINLDKFNEAGLSIHAHEVGHKIDNRVCGTFGSSRDPDFKALNTQDFRYGDANVSHVVQAINVTEEYSAEDVIEDKANLLEEILLGINPAYADTNLTIIRKKYRLLLARIENRHPGFAAYAAAISLPNEKLPLESTQKTVAIARHNTLNGPRIPNFWEKLGSVADTVEETGNTVD